MRIHNMSQIKKILSYKWFINNIGKIYLTLALFLGLIFSLVMPIFNEPDGQVHFTQSELITGNVLDIRKYNLSFNGSGMLPEVPMYQNGKYFEEYYLRKANFLQADKTNSVLLGKAPKPLDRYTYFGQLLPSIGLSIGRALYPSLGVMVTVARMFVMLIYSTLIFFLLRFLKFGKLVLFTIALSPVFTNQFSSLSYDPSTFISSIFLIVNVINILFEKHYTLKNILLSLSSIILLILFSKPNLYPLILLFPALLFSFKIEQRAQLMNTDLIRANRIGRPKRLKMFGWWFFVIGSAASAYSIFWIIQQGGETLIYRIWASFTYPAIKGGGNMDITTIFSQPYQDYNLIPVWVSLMFLLLLLWVCFTQERFVLDKYRYPRLIGLISLGSIILVYIATYYGFLPFPATYHGEAGREPIIGIQGRYFTPVFLMLIPLFSSFKFKKFGTKPYSFLLMLGIIIFSNLLVVYNTLYTLLFSTNFIIR